MTTGVSQATGRAAGQKFGVTPSRATPLTARDNPKSDEVEQPEADSSDQKRPASATRPCPFCMACIPAKALKCQRCGEWTQPPGTAPSDERYNAQSLATGIVGCALTGLGTFLPFFSVPIIGGINMFHNGSGDGTIILCAAAVGLLGFVSRIHLLAALAALGSGGVLLHDATALAQRLAENSQEAAHADKESILGGLGRALASATHLDVGVFVIGLGVLVTLIASVMPNKPKS